MENSEMHYAMRKDQDEILYTAATTALHFDWKYVLDS
jgi:hypothetical protein